MRLRHPARTTYAAASLVVVAVLVAVPGVAAGANSSSAIATAKKHLLTVAAMPKGWKVEKGSTFSAGSNNNVPGAKQLAACIGVPSGLITANPPSENSPYFQNKDQSLEVQDNVSVFPSAANARAQYAAISNAKTPACFDQLVDTPSFRSQMAASAGSGTTVGTVTVTKVSGLPKHSAGFVLTVPLTSSGGSLTFKSAQVFTIKGNLGHQISFNSYNATFPRSLMSQLTSKAQRTL